MNKRPTSRGSVYKNKTRGTWEYVVWVIDPDHPRGKRQKRKKGFPTRQAAEEALSALHAEIRTAVRDGRRIKRRSDTLAAFVKDHWLPTIHACGKLRSTTLAYYRFTIQFLLRQLGDRPLDKITGSDLTRLYGQLTSAGKSRSLVRGVHVTAHKVFKFAEREGLITWNQATHAEAPPTVKGKAKAWTEQEMHAIFQIADADRYWAAWRLLALTGIRRGELCGLTWDDVKDGYIHVRRTRLVVDGRVEIGQPKTSKSHRRIPLNKTAQDTLNVWRMAQAEELSRIPGSNAEGWIFTNEIGTAIDPSRLTKLWGQIVHEAGVPYRSLHGLRHTFATSLLARHKSPKVVQDLLGHSSISVTLDLYTASVDELGRDAVESLETSLPDSAAGRQETGQ